MTNGKKIGISLSFLRILSVARYKSMHMKEERETCGIFLLKVLQIGYAYGSKDEK
jgi:hypothetical protein